MIVSRRAVSAEDVARHYDELDQIYREVWGDHLHHGLWLAPGETPAVAALNLLDHLCRLLRLEPGSRVCDVGCGYGSASRYIASQYEAHVHGITLSQRQFAYANRPIPVPKGSTRFTHGDWLENRFEDASFDIVVAIESLAHMQDKASFFQEAERVLQPGGRLGICAWIAGADAGTAAERLLLEPICREGRLPSLGMMDEYVALATEAGLTVMIADDLSKGVRRTWSVIARRVLHRILTDRKYRDLLRDPSFESRVFALTILRLLVAYRTGAMRYGVIIAEKPIAGTID